MKLRITLLFLVIASLYSCQETKNESNNIEEKDTSTIQEIKKEPKKIHGIKGEGIELREGPGEGFPKVINQKTSKILKKTVYASVDYSVRVKIEEGKDDWSRISVVNPSYLSNSHQGWIRNQYILNKEDQKIESSKQPKIIAFREVKEVRDKLSKNGIGSLRNWRGDELGWLSSTDYYSFGGNSNLNGMKNNLSYSLESNNEDYISILNISLNINNINENKQAIEKFEEIISKTFKSLNLQMPSEISKKVTNKIKFKGDTENFNYELSWAESQINSWTFSIETKME